MSQIMSLINLCPSIQEDLLFLPPVLQGRDPLVLREVLPIACSPTGGDSGAWRHLPDHTGLWGHPGPSQQSSAVVVDGLHAQHREVRRMGLLARVS
jgi:hypothetical protein